MKAIHTPLILYIPGLLPKPRAAEHKNALYRCLIEGVRRENGSVADSILASEHSFDIVSWTYDFYRQHRDVSLDSRAINAAIEQASASEGDIQEAASWTRSAALSMYRLGDLLPFLIPHLASESIQIHLRDLRRYVQDQDGIAEHTREMLKLPLRAACESGRPVLLIAHSMGSVIAYDCLWQMTYNEHDRCRIDLLLTMGSPLGQNYLQKRIKGHAESGEARYPNNIRRWINLAAVGDLTAIDPKLSNDFGEMVDLGLVDFIDDRDLYNYFRLDGQLNVHAEYGYLANSVTGSIIADWWREHL